MQVACTNCDARYDVPDDAIPADGRDVQCSNCGHTWLVGGPLLDEPDPIAIPDPVEGVSGVVVPVVDSKPSARPSQEKDEYLEILREEAAREISARQADVQPVQDISENTMLQDEEDDDDDFHDFRGTRDFIKDTIEDVVPAQTTPPKRPSRRWQLPDIEDINPTLTAATQEKVKHRDVKIAAPDTKTRRQTGFKLGFYTALLILILCAFLYLFADHITQTYPYLKGTMKAYVSFIDDVRQIVSEGARWLTGIIQKANSLSGSE